MTDMAELEDLKNTVCELVSISEEILNREYFEELDNKGVEIINCLDELERYRAIGTVEEFKALEENERKCEDCGGCTAWKCDCANVRAKAIDEFVERLKTYMETTEQSTYLDELNKGNENYSAMPIYDFVDNIAEQMKESV